MLQYRILLAWWLGYTACLLGTRLKTKREVTDNPFLTPLPTGTPSPFSFGSPYSYHAPLPPTSPEESPLLKESFSKLESSLKPDEVLTYQSECNQQWTYLFQGTDWNCLCSTGSQQSPIDICSQSAQKTNTDPYSFQLLTHLEYQERYENIGKKVEVINTGKTIKMTYQFGKVDVMLDAKESKSRQQTTQQNQWAPKQIFPQYSPNFPQSLLFPQQRIGYQPEQSQFQSAQQIYLQTQQPLSQPNRFSPHPVHLQEISDSYDGYSMHLHIPSEHSINGQLFDMEMHLVMRNTRLMEQTLSADNVVVDQPRASYQMGMPTIFQQNYKDTPEQEQEYLIVVILFKGAQKEEHIQNQVDQFFHQMDYGSFPSVFLQSTQLQSPPDLELLLKHSPSLFDQVFMSPSPEEHHISQLQSSFNTYLLQYLKARKSQSQFSNLLRREQEQQNMAMIQRQAENKLFFLTDDDIEKVLGAVSCDSLQASSQSPQRYNHRFTDSNLQTILQYLTYDPTHPLGNYYSYSGSQSSPPCEQNVTYLVKQEALPLDIEIIKGLATKIEEGGSTGGNARATQNHQGRRVQLYNQDSLWSLLGFMKDMKCWRYPDKLRQVVYHFVLGDKKKFPQGQLVDLEKTSPYVPSAAGVIYYNRSAHYNSMLKKEITLRSKVYTVYSSERQERMAVYFKLNEEYQECSAQCPTFDPQEEKDCQQQCQQVFDRYETLLAPQYKDAPERLDMEVSNLPSFRARKREDRKGLYNDVFSY